MKYSLLLCGLLIMFLQAKAQDKPDNNSVKSYIPDSVQYKFNLEQYYHYEEVNRDSALLFAKQCLMLSQKNGRKINEAIDLSLIAYQNTHLGNFAESLKNLQKAYALAADPKIEPFYWNTDTFSTAHAFRLSALAQVHHQFGNLMWRTENIQREIFHYKEEWKIASEVNDIPSMVKSCITVGRSYVTINKLDSALFFEKQAEAISLKTGYIRYLSLLLYEKGIVYLHLSDTAAAVDSWRRAIEAGRKQNNLSALARCYHAMANYYLELHNADSSLYYAHESLNAIIELKTLFLKDINLGNAYHILSKVYTLGNQKDSIIKYQGLALLVNDSLTKSRIRNLAEFQNLSFSEQMKLQQMEKEREAYLQKWRTWALIIGLLFFSLIALLLYRNNLQKTKSNTILNNTLFHLKSTQAQLIQSEKMASLGELTAGIAHEIQNPLNFVNNFSEVNKELLVEMKEEMGRGNYSDADAIANDVIDNENKINLHGKRADAIVKGMLQHSQSGGGLKEPTNINALADEYLRLAYHARLNDTVGQGLKAKDKSFNATLKTDFDETIGNINVIPRDIGRVLLNLYNNAFYAVNEKMKTADKTYEPKVIVTTRLVPASDNSLIRESLPAGRQGGNSIIIAVTDNGNGISEKALDKVFQPFFTTKPTGQGTGLGLSLSYDIIKAHQGKINIKNTPGEGAEFIITLPINA